MRIQSKTVMDCPGVAAGTWKFQWSLMGIPVACVKNMAGGGHQDPVEKSMPP